MHRAAALRRGGRARASSTRERTPRFRYTFDGLASTVLRLTKAAAAISGLVKPAAASPAIRASVSVSPPGAEPSPRRAISSWARALQSGAGSASKIARARSRASRLARFVRCRRFVPMGRAGKRRRSTRRGSGRLPGPGSAEPRDPFAEVFESGGELFLAVGYTPGGAPFGPRVEIVEGEPSFPDESQVDPSGQLERDGNGRVSSDWAPFDDDNPF